MDLKRLINKSKDVKIEDYLSSFFMIAGLILSPFYKKTYKDTWGICERNNEARDNGYHFFKYMVCEHPEQRCVYVIDKRSKDYYKVKDLGKIVQFGSVKHWILYFSCKYLISSHGFMPNGYLCVLIERAGLFCPDHVFLQHGITKDKAEFLLAKNRRAKYFIAGAAPEYDFMKKEFGYPDGTMQYTGFARFDSLHDFEVKKNRILVMPTWRKWLRFRSETHSDVQMDFALSEYTSCWRDLLQSEALERMIDKYALNIIFYPQPNMKGILKSEILVSPKIRVANTEENLQDLMKSSEMLITDYSSVFFDMVYMKKPVIFYQFDEEKYRKYHYQQGWFDYHATAFGKSCKEKGEVLYILDQLIREHYQVTTDYLCEHSETFQLYDENNCKRIFEVLRKNNIR